jgi:superfamily II DNA/RNA helicase
MMTLIGKFPPIGMLRAHEGPYALILAPTRELALQIQAGK